MKLKSIKIPHHQLFTRIFGKEIYLVGGTVRDHILYGNTGNNTDFDLIVTGVTYQEIEDKLKDFGKTNTVGKSFAVVKFTIKGVTFDISIPRKDHLKDPSQSNHKNFEIDAGPHISLEEDLERRDFTCNSIAVRLKDSEIIDPFKGMDAISEKTIRMTSPQSFAQDPLRILRAARFASVHEFAIQEEIYLKAKETDLSQLSSERITEELFRLLMESPTPSIGLNHYFYLSIIEKLLPELYATTLTIQDSLFHPETDEQGHHSVWGHTLRTLDVSSRISEIYKLETQEKLTLLLASLFHDIGKPETTRWEYKHNRMAVTSIFHDSRGTDITEDLLERLKIDTRNGFPVKETILNLIKYHHRIFELYRNREHINYKTLSRLVRDMKGCEKLLILLDFADRQSREKSHLEFIKPDEITQWIENRLEELDINANTIEPIVLGRHLLKLGVKPGPSMGKLLEQLYNKQLDGEFSTLEEGLTLFENSFKN